MRKFEWKARWPDQQTPPQARLMANESTDKPQSARRSEVVRFATIEDNPFGTKIFLACFHSTERLSDPSGDGAPSFKPPCSVRYRPSILKMALHVSLSEHPPTAHAFRNVPVAPDSGMTEEHNTSSGHNGARSGRRVLAMRIHHSAPTVPAFAHFGST